MKTLKSDIFYAMNEINDKYILEAAQCLEQKKKSDISSQKKIKLFNESNAHTSQTEKWFGINGLGDGSDAFRHGMWNAECGDDNGDW